MGVSGIAKSLEEQQIDYIVVVEVFEVVRVLKLGRWSC
jgi:hypothetical protein